ncbi:3'-5' exonuclease, putative [Plasmodium malariae]|uniref:3'-5' exonuclease, putative n=1 Tax=Plasmodium malariae TaxID=5858 RepID=A0A1C3KAS0_PLAMA|nr:3'-5' exonuclease, putative [Plasmodium malariae]
MYKCFVKSIRSKALFKRTLCNVSYGYLNLTVQDRTMPYFENLKKNIIYINNSKDCKECINEIKKKFSNEKQNFIGLDIEGYKIGKDGIVSIIQICADDIYIFDIYKCDNSYLFIKYIKDLLEDERIVKVTHDCREDCSILYNQYDVRLNNIFDTQVAYNILLKERKKEMYQISFDDLLYKCLLLNNNQKIYFHKMIALEQKIYLQRPISKELIHYAVQDVLYLKPLMLSLVHMLSGVHKKEHTGERCSKVVSTAHEEKGEVRISEEKEMKTSIVDNISDTDIIMQVIKCSQKYINYQSLNSHIKNEKELQKGMTLEGMVVSCNNINIYVKLNLSKKGVIANCLHHKYNIGDIVKCVILGFGTNNYIKLGLYDSSIL